MVFEWRRQRLLKIRKNPECLPGLRTFYKENPAQFIIDWGCTYDPRTKGKRPAFIPFVLFAKQEEFIDWIIQRWRHEENGVAAKSRELGISWACVAVACTICLFTPDITIGFGSRKEEYIDSNGDIGSLLEKCRFFVSNLPKEFKGGWTRSKNTVFKKIEFPHMKSLIKGCSGDDMGRADRFTLFFKDEAAFIPRPLIVEAAISSATDTCIDVSTPNGTDNPFFEKLDQGEISSFIFHWKDDPRKDDDWYEKKKIQIGNPVIIAQELDLNFKASVDCIVIPYEWVEAAVDAHIKLNVEITGKRKIGFDVADKGKDKNAVSIQHGILIEHIEEWSGVGGDIFLSVEKVFRIAKEMRCEEVHYDADGLGASVRGDARVIGERLGNGHIKFIPFQGSGGVIYPEEMVYKKEIDEDFKDRELQRKNKDFFANYKAQSWWYLRELFKNTYRAVVQGEKFDPDEIISLSSKMKDLRKVMMELSQPTYGENSAGKLLINKLPDNSKSPNEGDAVMIASARKYTAPLGWYDV